MSQLGSLVRFNALACEEAMKPKCVCHCGGKYHGIRHPQQWIEQQIYEKEMQLALTLQSESDR